MRALLLALACPGLLTFGCNDRTRCTGGRPATTPTGRGRFFGRPASYSLKMSARRRPPQAAPFGRSPLVLDPLAQSCDVFDDDAAMIGCDQASPFEGAEHQCDGFPSRAYIARNLLMGELHTN